MREYKREWQRKRYKRMTDAEREAKRKYERDYYAKHKVAYHERHHKRYVKNRSAILAKGRKHYADNRDSILERRRELYLKHSVSHEYMARRRLRCALWADINRDKLREIQRKGSEKQRIKENILKAQDPTYYAFVRERRRIYDREYRRRKNPETGLYVPQFARRIPDWCPFAYSGIDFRSRFLEENIGTEERAFANELARERREKRRF